MPLMELWSSNPTVIAQFTIEQVVAAAGSGELRDNSPCSEEFRRYLAEVPSLKLAEYVDGCLRSHFQKGGMILQDLVNELGRRLDYRVENGRYQGTVNAVGYDGIWISPEGQAIIAEVKTTDAYRISLDTLAGYREKLVQRGQVQNEASVLIVVGRQDTGELEAQIRGSRHAWNMRLISADALIKLVQLKENADGVETAGKIRSLLVPREYTRLDEMVDVMFTTAQDVESVSEPVVPEEPLPKATGVPEQAKRPWEFTDGKALQEKRDEIIASLGRRESTPLIKKSRALYWRPNHDKRAAVTISKRYDRRNGPHYWYAYHIPWDEFLKEGQHSYVVLGCMDKDCAFALPDAVVRSLIGDLNTSKNQDGSYYWHLQLTEERSGDVSLIVPRRKSNLSLSEFMLQIGL